MPSWITDLLGAQAIATAGILIFFFWGMYKILPALRRAFRFLGEVMGEPEERGMDRRPSLLERLTIMEDKLETVRHEVEYNNGTSVKDGVRRTELALEDLNATFLEHMVESQRTIDIAERTVASVEAIIRTED